MTTLTPDEIAEIRTRDFESPLATDAERDRKKLLLRIRAQDDKLRRVVKRMEAHKQCRQQCNCLELIAADLNGDQQ